MKTCLAIVLGTLCVTAVGVLAPRSARAQDAGACSPACQAGEVCAGGTCMVPACRPACAPGETCVGGTCMVPAAPPAVEAPPPPVAPAPVRAVQPVAPSGEPPAPPQIVRRGAFVIPQVGVSAFMEEEARYISPGARVSALAGGFITNDVSLGGSLTFDLMNWDPPPGNDASGFMVEAAFTPLFHVGDERGEFVFGPALGGWILSAELSDVAGDKISGGAQGWALGGNAGLFVPAGAKVRLGAIFNFMVRETMHNCTTLNGAERCANSGPAHDVIGFTLAAML